MTNTAVFILIAVTSFCVNFLLLYFIFIKFANKGRNVRNAVDRLFDDVRFNDDIKSKIQFRKGLSLLVDSEYIKKSVFKRAATIFMKIASRTSDPLDKAYSLGWAGRCYEDCGNRKIAATCYAAAAELAPSDTFVLERLGDFLAESDLNESERLYNQVLFYDPVSSRAYYKLGKLFSNNNQPAQAVSHYQKSVEIKNGYVAPIAEAAIECAKIGDKSNMLKFYLLAMANDLCEFEKLEEEIKSCMT